MWSVRDAPRSHPKKCQRKIDFTTLDAGLPVGTMLRHTFRPLVRRPVGLIQLIRCLLPFNY